MDTGRPPTQGPAAYLGVDLGTSGLKLTLVTEDGALLAEAEETYAVRATAPGYAETDPDEWAAALRRALARLEGLTGAPEAGATPQVRGVGFAGQMHGVVLADSEGRATRPAILWPDQRAAGVLPRWERLPEQVRARLGNPLVAGMAGPVLGWLGEHEPASVGRAATASSPKDWLRGRLTGDRSTERSDASATLLWDVVDDTWSAEALKAAGVTEALLPDVVASDSVVGSWDVLGTADAPVVAGAADTAAALLAVEASGVADDWASALVVNLGTGVQLVRPGATPQQRLRPVTHLYADTARGWYEMLAVQNGGLALSWAHDVLGVTWEDAVALAGTAPTGSRGAVFAPFVAGERGGVAAIGTTGSWSGLTTAVGRAELVRAAFEGYAFIVRRGAELLGDADGPVILTGGGARDPWVRQLLVDVLGRPVRYVRLRSASAVGAAVLAARGTGSSLPVPVEVVDVVPGSPADRGALEAAYARWLEVAATG